LYKQGRSYIELEQNAQALVCFNEILSTTLNNNDSQCQAALAHHSIGQIYDNQGAFHRALESYMTALNIWTLLLKNNSKVNRHVIAQLLNDIAEIYERKKRYGFALWYYAQAIQFSEGDTTLVLEYQDSFQLVAKRAMDVLDVHIIQFE
jgi:tetratricopeptide (TPR) repeat protein